MNLAGSTISFPFRPDVRGAVATIAKREEIIAQAIADIIETRKGERVMMPDYGLDDYLFSVQDFSFAPRLAAHLEEQILKYVPLVKSVKVKAETDEQGRAIISLQYFEVGEVVAPKNLVYPVWRLLNAD